MNVRILLISLTCLLLTDRSYPAAELRAGEAEEILEIARELLASMKTKDADRFVGNLPSDIVLTDGKDVNAVRANLEGAFDQLRSIDGAVGEISAVDSAERKAVIDLTFEDASGSISVDRLHVLFQKRGGQQEVIDICNTRELQLRKAYEKLRRYPEFGKEQLIEFDGFSYASAFDPKLVELREAYRLGEVAGAGDEVSKILNLMRWVHKQVSYDGNAPNPAPRTAMNIIRATQEEGRGVNCRMMATVLNEVYLSMGYRSRFIACLPEQTRVEECHVVNSVFSETLDKWVYMDPSFEAYFTDSSGELLGLMEIRERLISGNPLVVNEELNLNGERYQGGRDGYKRYMAKNTVRFECPVHFQYETEPREGDVASIRLNPLDHSLSTSEGRVRNGRFVVHSTTSPEVFWGNVP